MIAVRIVLARHEVGDIVIEVGPGEVRRHVDAPPCPHCGGRGLLEDLERCTPCEATGLAITFERPGEVRDAG